MRILACAVGAPFALVATLLAQGSEPVYDIGNGVSAPKLVKTVAAVYTADAMRRGVEGRVGLKCVVDRDGVPQQIAIVKPLDAELDEVAIKALAQWRFEPGMKDGRPVSVRVQVEMSFVKSRKARSGVLAVALAMSQRAGTSVGTFGGIAV